MKRLTHAEALIAIDASRDQALEPALQQALDEHLAECADCRAYQAEFIELEKRLSLLLQTRWPMNEPDERQIASVLGNIPPHTKQTTMKSVFSNLTRMAAWGTLVVLFIALLGWGIRSLRPEPADISADHTSQASTIQPAIQTTEQQIMPSEPPAEQPSQATEVTAIQVQGTAISMPGIQFSFEASFPPSPEQVNLYRLELPEPVNAEAARQVAVQWGMQDPVVYDGGPSEAPDYILLDVTDSVNEMRFINFSEQFLFWPDYASVLDDNGPILPLEQQVAIAAEYLQSLGVLNESYRAVAVPEERSKVRFMQFLDDMPVLYGIGTNRGSTEWIDVAVDASGQVREISYAQHDYQLIGQYPILSAQQAWERFASEQTFSHGEYAVLGPERPVTYQAWARNPAYEAGQAVDLYGYVSIRQPLEAGTPASVAINNLNVNADPASFSAANAWDFIHLWGEINGDEDGNLAVNMQGWEISPLSDETLTGTIQRQGDEGLLSTKSGNYVLPELPENYPDGALANVRGVILQGNPAIFEWSHMDTGEIPFYYGTVMSCGGGGGGGGGGPENTNFGSGLMRGLNLSGVPTQATPETSSPYAPGDLIEGVIGTPYITIYQDNNGMQKEDIFFTPETGSSLSTEASYYLEGAALGGELSHNLPVRIWGQVDRYEAERSAVIINVSHFEPLYPGVQIQQWAGTETVSWVEGREVILLTTNDGQTYVISSTLQWPAQDMLIGTPGDLVGIEGYIVPGELYGGYAVIQDTAGEMPPDASVQSAQPNYDTSTLSSGGQAQYLAGAVTIERIELAYRSISLQRCTSAFAGFPGAEQYLTVQPVWVFTGHFDDGRQFQLQVQALPDEYLY